jgi:hypothetical protein
MSPVVRKSEGALSQPRDGIASFEAQLTSEIIYLKFRVDHALVANAFMITFVRNKGEKCPSFLYWFKKDEAELPAYSVAAACDETENTAGPRLRHKLAFDWTRTKDEIVDKYWEFEGRITYPEPVLDSFQYQSYQWIRLQMSNTELDSQTKEFYFKLL